MNAVPIASASSATVRVNTEKLDSLMDVVGELETAFEGAPRDAAMQELRDLEGRAEGEGSAGPLRTIFAPGYLLRSGADKAAAWDDLCLAADVAEGKRREVSS